jgi:hypothetical protein
VCGDGGETGIQRIEATSCILYLKAHEAELAVKPHGGPIGPRMLSDIHQQLPHGLKQQHALGFSDRQDRWVRRLDVDREVIPAHVLGQPAQGCSQAALAQHRRTQLGDERAGLVQRLIEHVFHFLNKMTILGGDHQHLLGLPQLYEPQDQ